MTAYISADLSDRPELIEVCINCHYPDCVGKCPEYRAVEREVYKLPMRRPPAASEYALFEAFGQRRTVSEWARIFGITRTTVVTRMRRNHMSLEEALTRPVRVTKTNYDGIPKTFEIDGETHTIAEWSKKTGVPIKRIYSRLKSGWEPRDAIMKKAIKNGKE